MTIQEQAEWAYLTGEYRKAHELFILAAQQEAVTHEGAMVLVEKAADALFRDMEPRWRGVGHTAARSTV